MQLIDSLQSQHLQEEPTGNKFLVGVFIHQQSKLMEPYGLGDVILMDNLEIILQPTDPLQSPHLLEEPTGNKLVVDIFIQQQSKLMELYGLGDIILVHN